MKEAFCRFTCGRMMTKKASRLASRLKKVSISNIINYDLVLQEINLQNTLTMKMDRSMHMVEEVT